ncbi:MAG TPA: short-chain dehydrogenase [Elusimicrobia bacterium]|nr:short-chain dehydrogenase [Elusimicrobiota bacterium]
MRPIPSLMSLKGRRALVTGAAGHIGLAICETLIELGAKVAVLDLDAARCRQRAQRLCRMRAGAAFALPCDLLDEAATRGAVRAAIRRMRGLDIVVHSAAYVGTTEFPGWVVPFPKQSVEAFDRAMRVNMTSAFVIVQEAHRALARSGRGSVILISSIYGVVGPDFSLYKGLDMANPIGYAASKGGLIQSARYLATALAPRVRTNVITPGGVLRGGQPAEFRRRYIRKTPLGRMATEEDLKGAVAFLASDLSAYVTGQNLMVDGGWTAW